MKCMIALLAFVALAAADSYWPYTATTPYAGYNNFYQQQQRVVVNPWTNTRQLINPYVASSPYHHYNRLFKREADSDAYYHMASPYMAGYPMQPYHYGYNNFAAAAVAPYHHQYTTPTEDHSAETPASTTKITYSFPHLTRQVISAPHHPYMGVHHLGKREAESDAFYYPGYTGYTGYTGFPYNRSPYMSYYGNHAATVSPYYHNAGLFGRRFF